MNHFTLKQLWTTTFYLLLISMTFQAFGQEDFNVYTVPTTAGEGLSDIRIMDVSGFGNKLWLATDMGGINTFDGANWENISEIDGLPSNTTTAITFDMDGNPWVGMRSGVATLVNDEWVTYRTSDGLAHGWITCAMRMRDGSLWFGSRGGINVYRDGQWSSPNGDEGFIGGYIYNIFEDADSNIWVATQEGANFFDGQTWTTISTDDGLSDNVIQDISQDKDGNIWIATFRNGINIESDTGWIMELQSDFIRDLNRGPDGSMYIGANNGVIRYDYQDFNRFKFTTDDSTDLHGYGNIINDIIIDGNNNIFAGTWNGLGVVTPQSTLRFSSVIGLCSNYITDIQEDAVGNLWFAGGSRGISVYTTGQQWQNYSYHNVFEGENVYEIFRDSKDIMWVATSGGAYYFENNVWHFISTKDGLPTSAIYSIAEDKEGRKWLGNYPGVTMISDTDTITYTKDDGLISDRIFHTLADSKGNLWFGSSEGLCQFNGDNFTTIAVGTEIPAINIRDLFEDSHGNIWVATNGGVSKYDGSNWTIYQTPDLSNNSSWSIREYEDAVYIGTTNGLNIYRDGKFDQFYSNDGTLYHNNVFCTLKASDGKWWFATSSDGVWNTDELDLTITRSDEFVSMINLNIYPNPATYSLHIDSDQNFEEWQIIALDGRVLKRRQIKFSDTEIPVHDLDPGVHILRLEFPGKESVYRKFIKAK